MEWRKVHNVDDALTWKIDDSFKTEFSIEFPGVDYTNKAVMYIPVGAWNVREMIEKGNRDQMLQYIYVVLETLVQNIEKTGEQFTIIVDLEGMTYYKVAHYESKLALCYAIYFVRNSFLQNSI